MFAAAPALLPFVPVEEAAVGFAPGFLLVVAVFAGIVLCVVEFCDAWFVVFDVLVVVFAAVVVGAGFGVAVSVVGATSAIVKESIAVNIYDERLSKLVVFDSIAHERSIDSID